MVHSYATRDARVPGPPAGLDRRAHRSFAARAVRAPALARHAALTRRPAPDDQLALLLRRCVEGRGSCGADRASEQQAMSRPEHGERVLSRLIYNPSNARLTVPASYGNRKVPWENGKVKGGAGKDSDPTLAHLVDSDRAFRGHFMRGMHVTRLTKLNVVSDEDLRTHAAALAAPGDNQVATAAALMDAAVAADQLLHHSHGTRYNTPADLELKWVMSKPGSFVPGEMDLPGADVSLRTRIPGKGTTTYWTYACVLIALVKLDDGWRKAKALTKTNPTTLDQMVQDLHKHYVKKNVQYDDSAARFAVMDEWGYEPIFMGRIAWKDLPKHVSLTKDKSYIFDIVGHTVVVTPTEDIAKDGTEIADPKAVLTPDSEKDNFARGQEFSSDVTGIWAN